MPERPGTDAPRGAAEGGAAATAASAAAMHGICLSFIAAPIMCAKQCYTVLGELSHGVPRTKSVVHPSPNAVRGWAPVRESRLRPLLVSWTAPSPRRSNMTATIGWEDGHGTDGNDWLGYREVRLSNARDWKERL